ncbi:aldo/keto reductase [Microbacterium sp. 18062]|uniref:aldo/keto reductase n=1 Tax=Microbacterium sp. 18062 TaxID=2681410 RepID=UPI001356D570|nr:aldo/keto reductase [Microbacterium sp. 18062]
MTVPAASTPDISLNTGASLPRLGLGVWQATDDEVELAVAVALDAGYRLIDTAAAYRNERGVGRGLAATGRARDDVFVTTKLWNQDRGRTEPLAAIDRSLERLGLEYVDLYLVHWPGGDRRERIDTWQAMEEIAATGKARAIGVCNFAPHHLQDILDTGGIVPAVNQIELHPHLPQWVTRAFDADHGIVTQSWSPLGGTSNSGWGGASKPNTLLSDPVIAQIADELGVAPAQVLIRWHLQNGLSVIPKSTDADRIRQNADVVGFALSGAQIEQIAALENGERVGFDPDDFV